MNALTTAAVAEHADRFLARIQVNPSGCWTFMGYIKQDGYGQVQVRVGHAKYFSMNAHAFAWELWRGPRNGLEVDHACHSAERCHEGDACRHRRCVNPSHLQLLTHAENYRRTAASQHRVMRERWWNRTECKNGHAWVPENVTVYLNKNGDRRSYCRICHREKVAAWRAARKRAA